MRRRNSSRSRSVATGGGSAPAPAPLMRWRDRWRRWDTRLGRRPAFPRAVLLTTVIVSVILVAVPLIFVVIGWVAAVSEDRTIAYEGPTPIPQDSTPLYWERQPGEIAAMPLNLPHPDWNESRLRRRAAAVLLIHGQPELVADVLQEPDLDPSVLNSVTTHDHENALQALRRALEAERVALAQAWSNLPDSAKRALFPGDAEVRRRFEESLAGTLRPKDLATWRARVPEPTLLRFVSNVAVRILEDVSLRLPYVKLLLEHAFPPRSVARDIFFEDPLPDFDSYEAALLPEPSADTKTH